MSTPGDQPDYTKMPYWFNVLVAIDQLGNAIADGNPDNTISARVGYFASDDYEGRIKPYWKALEQIIDFAIAPVQGPGHCRRAWQAEADETDTQGTYVARIILGIFVGVGCFFIGLILWLAVLIYPPWRYKPGARRYDTWRQLRQASARQRAERRGMDLLG
jgi:hypothetical protein